MSTCPSCGGSKDKRAKKCRPCHDQFEITEKVCTRCKHQKPISEFRIRTRATPRPRSRCRVCESALQSEYLKQKIAPAARIAKLRKWVAHNPDKVRLAMIRKSIRELGLAAETDRIIAKLESQTTCDICDGPPTGRSKRLAIDHDHQTGKFRGLLCGTCNLVLGKFQDDQSRFRQAAIYLETN